MPQFVNVSTTTVCWRAFHAPWTHLAMSPCIALLRLSAHRANVRSFTGLFRHAEWLDLGCHCTRDNKVWVTDSKLLDAVSNVAPEGVKHQYSAYTQGWFQASSIWPNTTDHEVGVHPYFGLYVDNHSVKKYNINWHSFPYGNQIRTQFVSVCHVAMHHCHYFFRCQMRVCAPAWCLATQAYSLTTCWIKLGFGQHSHLTKQVVAWGGWPWTVETRSTSPRRSPEVSGKRVFFGSARTVSSLKISGFRPTGIKAIPQS